uniref:Uncharacterized protein n=1 Tax=Cacopsylla melanoneura TaxID=428564 RepID=A0A8D8TW30_9HEMI
MFSLFTTLTGSSWGTSEVEIHIYFDFLACLTSTNVNAFPILWLYLIYKTILHFTSFTKPFYILPHLQSHFTFYLIYKAILHFTSFTKPFYILPHLQSHFTFYLIYKAILHFTSFTKPFYILPHLQKFFD